VLVDTYRFAVIAKSKKKTDKADASALARFLKLNHLPEVPVPSEKIRRLRQLLEARETLVSMRTRVEERGTCGALEEWHRTLTLCLRVGSKPRSISTARRSPVN
jgi:transposase